MSNSFKVMYEGMNFIILIYVLRKILMSIIVHLHPLTCGAHPCANFCQVFSSKLISKLVNYHQYCKDVSFIHIVPYSDFNGCVWSGISIT